jgi:hypothetical protein
VAADAFPVPALTPAIVPVFQAGDELTRAGAAPTCTEAVRIRHGGGERAARRSTSEQMRVLGELARAYGDGDPRHA